MADDRFFNVSENGTTKIAVMFTDIDSAASLYRTFGTSAGSAAVQKIKEVLSQVIRAYRGRIVKSVGSSLMAMFPSPAEALFAAIAMQKKMYGIAPEHGEPLELKVAINYGACIVEERDAFGDAVNIAGKLTACCRGREILVSESFHQEVATCSDISFARRAAPSELSGLGMDSVYYVVWEGEAAVAYLNSPEASPLSVLSELQHASLPGPTRRCFYCGAAAHETYQCPSKLLQGSTSASDRLCVLPLSRAAEILHNHYAEVVRPLRSGSADKRYEMILSGQGTDPFSFCFFAFFEASRLFQLRTILPLICATEESPSSGSIGALLMAADCLRVSRYTEAYNWLKRAEQDRPAEHRLLVLRALLNIEQDNPCGALDLLIQAHRSAPDEGVRRMICLLVARAHEICGDPDQARQELERADSLSEHQSDILFYKALLLIQSGERERATASLRQLFSQNPRYYLMLAVALPTLGPSSEMWAFLDREHIEILSRARAGLASLKRAVSEYSELLEPDDEALQKAVTLCTKAEELMQGETLSGLMDIPTLADEALRILGRSLGAWNRLLKRAVASFSRECERYSRYLAQFPYPRLVASRHIRLKEECLRLCEEFRCAGADMPPPPAREVKRILRRLNDAAEQIARAVQRLELIKLLWFSLLCVLKFMGVCCTITLGASLACSGVLIAYRIYEESWASLNRAVCIGYLRFGIAVGAFVGAVAAGFWFAKNFGSMYKKIDRTQ